jgi:hypothetical protein
MAMIDADFELGECVTSEPITDRELAEIANRCDQATPGPWLHSGDGIVENGIGPSRVMVIACKAGQESSETLPAALNGEFIARAREDLPRLVQEVLRLRQAMERIANEEIASAREFARAVLENRAP